MIPREFRGLTDMRNLNGFPAHVDGDWCSLDELGPLTQLRSLSLVQLENISASSSAANARLGEKMHIVDLFLSCTSRLEHDGLVVLTKGVSKEEQRRIEKVFDELCPPTSVQFLDIRGYFGQQLPNWMMSKSVVSLNNLKSLLFSDLACCNQLPNGLCQLSCLQFLQVNRASCIRSVGTEFLHPSQVAAAPFPRLQEMRLFGMVEWEEWEWEEKVQAMPRLAELFLNNCKLGRLPPGLASNARALRKLSIKHVKQLRCLESFPSVIELTVTDCPDMERISYLPKVQKLTITTCPKLKFVKDVPALLNSIALLGKYAPEFAKFSHVEHVKAKSNDWYVLCTREPYRLDTNANSSFLLGGTLPIFEDAQRLESELKMPRRAFDYVCSLVKKKSLRDMNKYTFLDGRFLCLRDRVAIALIVLSSAETPATIGSSVGVNESTLLQVTERFVHAIQWPSWPSADKIEKIKFKFDKIYGLPNCCGVVYTTRIPFGSRKNNNESETNDDMLMQIVVDSDMRFTDVELGWSDSKNHLRLLHDSDPFRKCEKGDWLNGTKLEVSTDGSEEVGEYIIGGVGYPLRPWLLTPYLLENGLSESKVEFNKRHSEAMAIALRALARLKDTWKWLHGGTWRPDYQYELERAVQVCCRLHNIVIDMELEGAGMPSEQKAKHSEQVRQIADEDAVRARDLLSQYMTRRSSESIVDPVDQEEQQEVASEEPGRLLI